MKRLHFIINPVSGNGRSLKVWSRLKSYLDRTGTEYDSHETSSPDHAAQLAKMYSGSNDDVILTVGGDGTAFEAAQSLLGGESSLAIIPAGTGNDFIKSLKLPYDPLKILELVLDSEPKSVDAGLINDKIFINACGIGFDVSVLDLSQGAKKYFKGIIPYLWGVLRTIIHYKPVSISLIIDGEMILTRDILVCSVANGIYIGGGMPISPESKVNDGFLDVVVVENVNRWRMIRYLPGLLSGKILTFKDTTSYRGQSITITSPDRMRLNVDGEVIPVDKAEFRIVPGGLKVFCGL